MTTFLDRLIGRQPDTKAVTKAVTGPGVAIYNNQPLLSSLSDSPQSVAKSCLAAYKVGWFYKAESRISRDFASLSFTLSYEDTEGDNEEAIVSPRNSIPLDMLSPEEQFLRLWENPNPYQTGRQLKQKTQIRLDMAGSAFIYMEGGLGGALPTGLYGISPSRMWPSYDKQGHLIGWVMDKDRADGMGVPFEADEIMPITYSSADDTPFGVGVVEAVYAEVPLSNQIARHTSDVLATGGRLAGMLWPKDRTLDEAEFLDAQRAWRNVASDPNAARRMLLFPEPMEYAQGASTPAEIGIPELAMLNRDTILTAFPIHPFMVGVPLTAGLNSGESLRYVRREYWEGTMHPRSETWEDAIQQHMVPRYEKATGAALDFDVEEPDLDDAAAVLEKVGALRGLIDIGFDTKDAIGAVGLDHIEWIGTPAPVVEPVPDAGTGLSVTASDDTVSDGTDVRQTITKATRDDVIGESLPGMRAAIASFLKDQRARVAAKIEDTLPASKAERIKADPVWWDAQAEDRALADELRTFYLEIDRNALQVVANTMSSSLTKGTVNRLVLSTLRASGESITAINETTRAAIAAQLETGVARGYSINQLVAGVPKENFGGVQNALLDNGVPVWDDYRAEMISRTETMRSYNQAALHGYKELNVRRVQALDGDFDPVCEDRNGQTFPIDEAFSISDHPNGTLEWAPITKSVDRLEDLTLAVKALAERETPAPVVNVTMPEPREQTPVVVNVPEAPTPIILATKDVAAALAPDIHIEPTDLGPVIAAVQALGDDIKAIKAPQVKVAAPEVTVNVDNVRVTSLPDRLHKVTRDKAGKPIGSVATDA